MLVSSWLLSWMRNCFLWLEASSFKAFFALHLFTRSLCFALSFAVLVVGVGLVCTWVLVFLRGSVLCCLDVSSWSLGPLSGKLSGTVFLIVLICEKMSRLSSSPVSLLLSILGIGSSKTVQRHGHEGVNVLRHHRVELFLPHEGHSAGHTVSVMVDSLGRNLFILTFIRPLHSQLNHIIDHVMCHKFFRLSNFNLN